MPLFLIPDDFRAFMQHVVTCIDTPGQLLDGDDALRVECGYGGRIDSSDSYHFTYLSGDGEHRWSITLREAAIRNIADGLLIEVMGEQQEIVRTQRRVPSGAPLLIWGEYGDDALSPRENAEVLAALDSLHDSAIDQPLMLRMWSNCDDQLVAVVWGERCALYVLESLAGYATSTGDASQTDAFPAYDHDGKPLVVPFADCVAWPLARGAMLHFLTHGDLGPTITVEGRIPSMLLMMGDVDRKAVLAARAEPPREVSRSSIPRMLTPVPEPIKVDEEPTTPVEMPIEIEKPMRTEELSAWARRLIELLFKRELIELGPTSLDEISYQLGGLLQAHGREAQHSIDTAEWLANEIGAVRGVQKLFATGGDLQIALRRSRDT